MPNRKIILSGCTAAQIRYMIDFMSKNPDLLRRSGSVEQLDAKWRQLKNALKEYGPDKTVTQWEHSWRDLVKHARYEKSRLEEKTGIKRELSHQASAILEVIQNAKMTYKEDKDEHYDVSGSDGDPEEYSEEPGTAKASFPKMNKKQTPITANTSLPKITKKQVRKPKPVVNRRRNSGSTDSNTMEKNSSNHFNIDSNLLDTLNKFIEFKKEKNRLAHVREMDSIKQNEKMLNLVGRMVNVTEDLVPSIRNFLHRNLYVDRKW